MCDEQQRQRVNCPTTTLATDGVGSWKRSSFLSHTFFFFFPLKISLKNYGWGMKGKSLTTKQLNWHYPERQLKHNSLKRKAK